MRSSTSGRTGIYVKAGLERRQGGAAGGSRCDARRDEGGVGPEIGLRESVESCSEVLRDLKARGIEAPRLLMADGNAAIWGAVRQVTCPAKRFPWRKSRCSRMPLHNYTSKS